MGQWIFNLKYKGGLPQPLRCWKALGRKVKGRSVEAEMLIISSVNKVFRLMSGYCELKADYLQSIPKKFK